LNSIGAPVSRANQRICVDKKNQTPGVAGSGNDEWLKVI
jgi:hypothetical protein